MYCDMAMQPLISMSKAPQSGESFRNTHGYSKENNFDLKGRADLNDINLHKCTEWVDSLLLLILSCNGTRCVQLAIGNFVGRTLSWNYKRLPIFQTRTPT